MGTLLPYNDFPSMHFLFQTTHLPIIQGRKLFSLSPGNPEFIFVVDHSDCGHDLLRGRLRFKPSPGNFQMPFPSEKSLLDKTLELKSITRHITQSRYRTQSRWLAAAQPAAGRAPYRLAGDGVVSCRCNQSRAAQRPN